MRFSVRVFFLVLWGSILTGCGPQQPSPSPWAPDTRTQRGDAVLALARVVPRSLPFGRGGHVRIEGSGFVPGCQVSIGGLPSPAVEFRSPTELWVALPQPSPRPGAQTIEVSAAGQRVVQEQLFYLRAQAVELAAPSVRPLPRDNQVRLAVDLDRDGRDDLITAESLEPERPNALWVFLTDGSGNPTPPRTYWVPGLLYALASADLDRDGYPDLVAYYHPLGGVGRLRGHLLVYRGDAAGNLAVIGEFETEADIEFPSSDALVIADFNRDGLLDLIYVEKEAIAFRRGLGGFRFEKEIRSSLPVGVDSVYVGAFDADSALDVLALWRDSPLGPETELVTLSGDGRGRFGSPQNKTLPFAAHAVSVGKVNGDAYDDVLISQVNSGQSIHVLDSKGRGQFEEPVEYPTSYASNVILPADLDGDGSLDLLAVGDGGTEFFRNDGRGGFAPGPPLEGLGGDAAVQGDFDGDGVVDLALSRYESSAPVGRLTLQKDIAGRCRGEPNALPIQGDVSVLAAGPLGATRPAQLLYSTRDFGELYLIPNQKGRFEPPSKLNYRWSIIPTALRLVPQLDPDSGFEDLAVAGFSTSAQVFAGGPQGFMLRDSFALGTISTCAAAGDLDGSGSLDLAFCGEDGAVYLVYRSASGSASSILRLQVRGTPVGVAIADLDGDGRSELAIVAQSPDGLVIRSAPDREGGGRPPQSYLVGKKPRTLEVVDLNLDGHPDIGVGADSGVYVLLADGRGGVRQALEAATGFDCRALATADLDGDGNRDLLCASETWGAVTGLLGDGSGLFPVQRAWHVGRNAITLAVADFDGDDRPDVAAGSRGRIQILWNRSR